jgi:hypothetical protein
MTRTACQQHVACGVASSHTLAFSAAIGAGERHNPSPRYGRGSVPEAWGECNHPHGKYRLDTGDTSSVERDDDRFSMRI